MEMGQVRSSVRPPRVPYDTDRAVSGSVIITTHHSGSDRHGEVKFACCVRRLTG